MLEDMQSNRPCKLFAKNGKLSQTAWHKNKREIFQSPFRIRPVPSYKLQKKETKTGTLISMRIPWKIARGIISFPE